MNNKFVYWQQQQTKENKKKRGKITTGKVKIKKRMKKNQLAEQKIIVVEC